MVKASTLLCDEHHKFNEKRFGCHLTVERLAEEAPAMKCISQEANQRYCLECGTICHLHEQGLCCHCDKPWETEVCEEKEYPEKWVKVTVQVWRKKDD